jgi:beta-glucosidase
MKYYLIPLFTLLSLFSVKGQAQSRVTPVYQDLSLDFETRAMDLVQQMTLDEKISQLGNDAPEISRLGVSKYNWWNEALHGVARAGYATVFPQAIGLAASFDTAMMKQVADIISDEARAKHHEALRNSDYGKYKGLTFWSPNINILRDPRWGRGHETYGEDPYLTGQMGMQFVKGLQGDDPKYLKLVATAKHYAVHNGPEPERHVFNVVPNTRDLWETYLPAFKDLMVDAKAYSIMSAYNRVDGESSSASWLLLEDILRNKWGFEGYVVSDCGAIRDIYKFHKIVNTPEEAVAIGVRKGCDLNCGSEYQSALKKAIELGYIDEGELDLSVYRLMLARMKLGMFDPEEMVPYSHIPIENNDCEAHNEVALEMALKTMTLLKNDGVLPLNKNKIKRIAVVGPNADNPNSLLGNYAGTPSHPVTVIDGIRNAVGAGVEVSYSEGIPMVMYDFNRIKFPIVPNENLFTFDENGEKVSGLTGYYFNNMNLTGVADLIRVDPKIEFQWAWNESPTTTDVAQGLLSADKAIKVDDFSVRWTGKLVAPMTGTFNLGLSSEDGCRLFIDGKLIANGWSDHGMETFLGEVQLVKGKTYDLKLEYYDKSSRATVNLVWETPDKITNDNSDPNQLSKETLADVKNADVAIFVGGLDASWEGEQKGGLTNIDGFNQGDRTKIELPKIQMDALKAMKATGTPVIFVQMAGGAMAYSGLEKELNAILVAWYPGQRGGDAVANVLFGDYNPAGRLPVTFYSSTNELPDFTNYNMHAGKGFTYRYYTGDALYPFGHGLSYTTFKYSNLKIDKTSITNEDEISLTFDIKNTGKLDGEEVVQLYIKDVESDKWMALKQLRKFERIALKKGESKTVKFNLKASEDLRYYDSMHRTYMVEPGDFEVQIGASSEDIRLKEIFTIDD